MDESEKTTALKKAYAEIILNTAKEAAARITISERKAIRYQHDLFCTKEEALHLLVRLKRMIDAKTIEAEITSSTQERKIDELEAQLHEAEDIITDLRSELELVRDKLEKVKKNQVQPLKCQIVKDSVASHRNATSRTIHPSLSNSGFETVTTKEMKITTINQRILDNKCCCGTKQTDQLSAHLDHYYVQNSGLGSKIIRGKEPELYKNGCTQRFRALERNLLNEKLPGDVDDQSSLINSELITETSDKDERKCMPFAKIKILNLVKNFSRKQVKKPVKARPSSRRKTRFGKAKASTHKLHPGQFMKPQRSVLSLCKIYSINRDINSSEVAHICPSVKADIKDTSKNFNDQEEELQHKGCCPTDALMWINKGKRSSVLTYCNTCSYPTCVNNEWVEYLLERAEKEAKMKPLPRLDPGLTLITRNVDLILGSTNVTVSAKVLDQSRVVQSAADEDTELRDESMLVRQEDKAMGNLTVPCSGLIPEMVNVPQVYSDLTVLEAHEETDGSPSKLDGNGILKYTFQRKRKTESLSDPDISTSPEKSTIKRRAGEKQEAAPEPQKSSLVNESSRDSRRLAQVARQLISLSGKRWS
ncbi:hypothetical protein CFOL_v3_16567 [Cephalotus follicularis]|uniref:Uncharacterized protein n=1 Tax=Cephalotus follicularis TaxID=3775 RepID=A0A1Q3BYK0_CEPFO|nr:hypothetical protein CFOL_v3_16567 [Cephalotus follicularis]